MLIEIDSLNRSPWFPVRCARSEPAKSTKWNFEVVTTSSAAEKAKRDYKQKGNERKAHEKRNSFVAAQTTSSPLSDHGTKRLLMAGL